LQLSSLAASRLMHLVIVFKAVTSQK